MNIAEFLSQLLALNIQLWVDEERLRYRAHQGALTPDLQAQLVKHKAEIIAYLKESARVNEVAVLPAIQPAQRSAQLPLSYAQERLWFLYQLDPINNAHNIFNAVRLHGPLDFAVLSECFNLVVARHESLRTTFATVAGQATQIVTEKLELSLTLISLQDLPSDEQNNRIKETALQEARRPFDLEHGPLVRVTLLKLDEVQHVLLLAMHHIISDGWSAGVLLQEMIRFYEAALLNKPALLPVLPIQYIDFAIWQREWLQGEVLETQHSYWRNQLANLTVLDIPTDRERSKVTSYAGATYVWELAPSLSSELKRLVQQQESSLFMALLAAFSIVLHRYSQQLDIAVRSPIANRTRKEIEGLIGYFVNTLILRVDMTDHPNFDALLHRVDEVCLGAYAHQDMPFEKVMDDLQLARREGRRHGPLFPVMFILQNAPLSLPNVPGFDFEALDMEDGLAPFELTVAIREMNNTLQVNFNYNTDLFEAATMRRMGQHFEHILQAITANPQQPLSVLAALIPLEEIPTVRGQAKSETAYAAPRTPVEETLAKIWAEALGIEKAGIYDNFLELGGDSLLSMSVVARAREAGLRVSPQDIYQSQTIAELAIIEQTNQIVQTEENMVTGPVPLMPMIMLNYAHNPPQPWWKVLVAVVELPRLLGPVQLREITQSLIVQHDNLRLRLIKKNDEPELFIAESDEQAFMEQNLSHLLPNEQDAAIHAAVDEQWESLNFSTGPLLRIVFFDLGRERLPRTLIILHHFAADSYSRGILLNDFQIAIQQTLMGEPIRLPPKTTSIKQWAEKMYNYTHSNIVKADLDYWRSLPWTSIQPTPVDHPEVIYSPSARLTESLSQDETQILIKQVPIAYNVELLDVLLTACILTYARYTRLKLFSVLLLHHGRNLSLDGINLMRTVGNFYVTYPLFFDVEQVLDNTNPQKVLELVVEKRKRVPHDGATWPWISYYSDEKVIAWYENKKIVANAVFNYLGQTTFNQKNEVEMFQNLYKPAEISTEKLFDIRGMTPHTCATLVERGRFKINWEYYSTLDDRSTVEKLAQDYLKVLRAFLH